MSSITPTYGEEFAYIIGTQKYHFKVTLLNPENDVFALTKPSVKKLILVDNLLDPWIKGSVTVDDSESGMERYTTNPSDLELTPDKPKEKGYTFRGDGRDFINVEIIPLEDTGLAPGLGDDGEDFQKTFGLNYTFTIKKTTPTDVDGTPCKAYQISDFELEILKDKKSFFSTGKLASPEGVEAAQGNNEDRYAATGDCIKAILTDVLQRDGAIFTQAEGITPRFESGASKLFYSSPMTNTAYDDIKYLSERHVSDESENDFSILKKKNFTGEYELTSVSRMFKQAFKASLNTGGELFRENFTITGGGKSESNIVATSQKKPDGVIEFGEKGDIISHNFFDTDGAEYKKAIKSQVVNSYDFKNKRFQVDVKDGNVNKVKEQFSENFANNLKGDNNSPAANLPLTESQKESQTFDSTFSEYGESPEIRKAYGANKLLKSSLFSNMGIEIIVQGQLLRQTGTFFSIDRAGDYIDNNFDNKLLGTYFLVEVEHQFIDDTKYLQKLTGIKTYHYDDPKFNENTL